jgi:hypothetical protein
MLNNTFREGEENMLTTFLTKKTPNKNLMLIARDGKKLIHVTIRP